MPIEKILIRSLIGLALIFLILTLTYYPHSYAPLPLGFLIFFIGAEFALRGDSEKEKKSLPGTPAKILIVLMSFGAVVTIAAMFILWKAGYLWHLK